MPSESITSNEDTLSKIQCAATDGGARNLRSRQKSLIALFSSLTKRKEEFVEALQTDNDFSKGEAQIAVSAMLLDLRKHYERLDLKEELELEYSIRDSKSHITRRVAQRIAYIIPDPFTMAFSVFSALCAAIEAGSSCVVEVSHFPVYQVISVKAAIHSD
jgi:acyl-CoA reductase-like NAD-dependent aldehyde dehydrogenase